MSKEFPSMTESIEAHPKMMAETRGTAWTELVRKLKDGEQDEAQELATLRAENQALREALEAVEWRENDEGDEVCALCGELKWIGHFSDCKLGNALKLARGELKAKA